jgi:hypothetical protein
MSNVDALSESDFRQARSRALFNRVVALLSGQRRELLAYDEVREKLHLGGPVYRGVQTVPVDKIAGSVDRYRDFDNLFLPTQSRTQDRWHRINRAWYQDISLPPVLLYKVGDVYFVVDGNHRVSVARSRGQEFIDAEVRECAARVPLHAGISPDDLELLHARVEFLERSRIDEIRPEAQIETTVLGGYDRLIEHIAVHRYYMGLKRRREISEAEAVAHWYDTIFKPVSEVIEQSGVLESFPGRTTADMYLWVMDHLHFLRSQPGGELVDPASAAQDYIDSVGYEGSPQDDGEDGDR